MNRILLAMLAVAPVLLQAQRAETGFLDRSVTLNGLRYPYQVYVPAEYAGSTQRWPVILFLHGAGERGDNGLIQTQVGLATAIRRWPSRYPAIVVMPQAPEDSLWQGGAADAAIAALDQAMADFRTDPDRVYVTGLSMGGNGTWALAYRDASRFAAFAPICGFISGLGRTPPFSRTIVPADAGDAFAAVAQRVGSVPVWIFHGEADPVVPVAESRRMYDALKARGGDVRYSEIPGGGHDVWDLAYGSPAFSDWLFAQRRQRR